MTKEVRFENLIEDAITETFTTLKELKAAIRYFENTKLSELLAAQIPHYEEMEKTDK